MWRAAVLGRRAFSSRPWLHLSQDVARAVRDGAPVVALETAIVTHGLPRPANLQTALAMEEEVRAGGAVPASIAVLGGQVRVGLSEAELGHVAEHAGPQKASRRDLARLLADRSAVGGTTVSGTLVAAQAAGIAVFATGGIGGVHRGASTSWDVSADLAELGRSAVCVVCSGAKSILDVPKTLEVLETHGVAVVTLGADFFPAFFARSSGIRSPGRVETPAAAADILAALLRARLASGMLLAVPIPENAATGAAEVEKAILGALAAAESAGVSGRDVTPFVLRHVNELTGGASLAANVALVKNNAKVAAQLASELSHRRAASAHVLVVDRNVASSAAEADSDECEVLVVGGSNVDVVCSASSGVPVASLAALPASYPGVVRQACGGVGRNVAEVVARLSVPHRLLTAFGADPGGRFLRASCPQLRWDAALERSDLRTAHYVALLNSDGQLQFGIADMDIHDAIDPAYLCRHEDLVARAKVVSCDANAKVDSLREVTRLCSEADVPLWFDATDVLKATRLLDAGEGFASASVNLSELSAMLADPRGGGLKELGLCDRLDACRRHQDRVRVLSDILRACDLLGPHLKEVLVKLGPHGALLWPHGLWCAAPEAKRIVSVSGAGDSFLGAFLVSRYNARQSTETSLWAGIRAAEASLSTHVPIAPSLRIEDFRAESLEVWVRERALAMEEL